MPRSGYRSLDAGGQHSESAAGSYPDPTVPFAAIRDCLAFHATRVDACRVGDFNGGWITSRVVGPFKGAAGTRGW
tara:strand:+ start:991 stop:1215 length:225 start_codon:yes stop_codon:yes gene_type:complete